MVDITDLNVECESCGEIMTPEKPENHRRYGVIGALFVAVPSAVVGSLFGIATAGAGFAATLPLGVLGTYLGYSWGKKLSEVRDGFKCPNCKEEISSSFF